MTIIPFAAEQTDVFVPALGALAVATFFAVLPVIFAHGLRRRRGGRALTALCIVLAAAVLVVTAVQAGAGFRMIADERARVGAEIASEYGLHLDSDQVGTLVDGGGLANLDGYGTKGVRFALIPPSTDDYRLVYGKGTTATPLPRKG